MKVGKWLREEKNNLKVKEVAKMLEVSERTLSNWQQKYKEVKLKKIGRPKEIKQLATYVKVGRAWKKQGCPGWRPIKADLGGQVSTRQIQAIIARLKLLQRVKHRKNIEKSRQSISVRSKNIFWSQDGAQYKGKKYQVIKDRGSQKIIKVKKIRRSNSYAVIKAIEECKKKRGLPLVLGTDNGSDYISKQLERYMEANKIIHLRSLPRTPQHNGAVECAIRELKEAATANRISLESAGKILNKNRLRASFLFKTSDEMDEELVSSYAEEVRERFYASCKERLSAECAGIKNGRSRRLQERKVILKMLEQFDLIKINRGKIV